MGSGAVVMSDGFMIDYVVDARDPIRKLERIEWAVGDENLLTILQGPVPEWFQGRMKERFANEGDDAVGQWEPLDDDTIQIKEHEEGRNRGINVRTGALRDWLLSARGALEQVGAGGVFEMSWPGDAPETSDLDEKLRHLQMGSTDPFAPPRPVIGASVTDLAGIMEIMKHWIFVEAGFVA